MKTHFDQRGFTLLEVLVAITILVIITSVVYASLSSVTTATEIARTSADELRLRQFLSHNFQQNFSTAISDSTFEDERYVLIGISEKGTRGAMDSIEFASSAPTLGGGSPPGATKRVYYGAVSNSGGSFDSEETGEPEGAIRLESSELMMLDPAVAEEYGTDFFGDGGGRPDEFGQGSFGRTSAGGLSGRSSRGFGDRSFSGSSGFGNTDRRRSDGERSSSTRRSDKSSRTPSVFEDQPEDSQGWDVPLDQFDVSYFDGYEWVEDWDSIEYGMMPWAVRVRLNYARTDEEYDADREAGINEDEDFDFEMVYTIPIGAGLLTEEDRMNAADGMRTNSSGQMFGDRNRDRDQDRRSTGSDDDDDNRSNRNRNSDRNRNSSFSGSGSGRRGGGLFGN